MRQEEVGSFRGREDRSGVGIRQEEVDSRSGSGRGDHKRGPDGNELRTGTRGMNQKTGGRTLRAGAAGAEMRGAEPERRPTGNENLTAREDTVLKRRYKTRSTMETISTKDGRR